MSTKTTDLRTTDAGDPPRVETAAVWSERSRCWALTVLRCPFCTRRHFHGGGSEETPDFGFRLTHCVTGAGGQYELVPVPTAHASAKSSSRSGLTEHCQWP